jgi:hemerythrin-like domain-containing protein
MNLIDALLGEHAVLYALFEDLEDRVDSASLDEVRAACGPVTAGLLSHAHLEDELLFPALERALGEAGPLVVMRSEHQEIDRLLARAAVAAERATACGDIWAALELARDHFAKEEAVLFPMARDALDEAELGRLGAQWARLRSVRV